ncbi:bifunctional D-cysteine desulfhydrase/1-aminocyclopropane-1-carboxylate deaminase, mitochondrial-like isoform X2 [Anneissia japonica]|uniref:bifunctional D-cysteine desulfhydrase/1-aminocyclopropane-1-carboxylate deaminase, mitochondrial-like isoform X2 n=1 Tax=Anneissia japonica TaxID=1529436 RepID=UPI001425675E|nr:bifunctional D-cysteine desulfhydrase/1-aminocyclopropane-1-carboxylate deaminase, mitochondrial-like isoform X2 [Anneissia japonica]
MGVTKIMAINSELMIADYKNGSFNPAELFPYQPPNWANCLKQKPKFRVKLIQPNTPIYKWNVPKVPVGFQLSVKRDDMTGVTLSGNKARKLEFIFGEAIHQKCGAVITTGNMQSNHCRSTAVASKQLGLESHLLIRSNSCIPEQIKTEGNMFIDMMVGASVYLVPPKPYINTTRMEKLAEYLRKSRNLKAYIIQAGGSDTTGLYGYIEAWQELVDQGVLEHFDDVAVTGASGGTAAGIAIANYLTGSKLKVHVYMVRNDNAYLLNHIAEALSDVGLDAEVNPEELVHIEDSVGLGYAQSTPEELEFITSVSMKTGVILDPTYTGKAAYGLVKQLNTDPRVFKGNRILFIHTGGIFGCTHEKFQKNLSRSKADQVQSWKCMDDEPPQIQLR